VITRPFHWGIVAVSDPSAYVVPEEIQHDRTITATETGLVALVRHAQDVPSFEGDFDWAEVIVTVRLLTRADESTLPRRTVYAGLIATPSGRLSFGDADGDVVVIAHEGATFITASVPDTLSIDDLYPEALFFDLVPG
jgi:hypothetical protein